MSYRSCSARCMGLGIVAILFILAAGQAWANAPAPVWPREPEPVPFKAAKDVIGEKAPLVVRHVQQAQSRIIIPRRLLPEEYSTPKVSWDSPQRKVVQTGTLLTCVIACGGAAVVFVRRRKGGPAIMACLGVLAAVAAVGTVMAATPPNAAGPVANQAPPSTTPKPVPQIVIQVVEQGNSIVLELGKDASSLVQ